MKNQWYDHNRLDRHEIGAAGKVVKCAFYDLDAFGYPFVRIEFEDWSVLTIEEIGQCGEIGFELK